MVTDIKEASGYIRNIIDEIHKVIIGQEDLVKKLMVALLSDGHILLEGYPGLGKTMAVKTLANALNTCFQRIQFTPDLLPADVVGTQVYNPKTDTWATAANMPTPRNQFLMVKSPTGRIITIGGGNSYTNNQGSYYNVVEVYDPQQDLWCEGPAKPTPSSEMAAAAPQTADTIYAIGRGAFGVAGRTHEALELIEIPGEPSLECPANLVLECPANQARIQASLNSARATEGCQGQPIPVVTQLLQQQPGGVAGRDVQLGPAVGAAQQPRGVPVQRSAVAVPEDLVVIREERLVVLCQATRSDRDDVDALGGDVLQLRTRVGLVYLVDDQRRLVPL